jgi:hypothetical protein
VGWDVGCWCLTWIGLFCVDVFELIVIGKITQQIIIIIKRQPHLFPSSRWISSTSVILSFELDGIFQVYLYNYYS